MMQDSPVLIVLHAFPLLYLLCNLHAKVLDDSVCFDKTCSSKSFTALKSLNTNQNENRDPVLA
jgi:hypothetical protein